MMSFVRSACVVLGLSAVAQAQSFTQLVSFGDSLSDVGNLKNLTTSLAAGGFPISPTPGGPGYFNGRFSNGPVWVEQLSSQIGLAAPLPATGAGGTNFAFGNATSGTGNSLLVIPNIRTQINNWTGGNVSTATQLFTVLGGANDLFAAIENDSATLVEKTLVAQQAATNIAGGVQALYADGARNILVANLPDLGLVPRFLGTEDQTTATTLSQVFDTTLAGILAGVSVSSPGLNLYQLDLDALFDQAIANRTAYGLTDVENAAYTGDPSYAGTGTAVANPGGFLFWDDVHPTTTGHGLIANAAAALVPEPASLAVIALTAMLSTRRRRTA